jgi:hypothetical protein
VIKKDKQMKYYIAKYVDQNGEQQELPAQSKKQLELAFDHLINVCGCDPDSWIEIFVGQD